MASLFAHGFSPSPGTSLLEVGCGAGEFLSELLGHVEHDVVLAGTDISPTALERARAKLEPAGAGRVALSQADIRELPFPDGAFHHVVALGVLEHVRDMTAATNELARVVAPGGAVWIFSSNTRSLLYVERLVRQALRLWPFGFQRNLSPAQLAALLPPPLIPVDVWAEPASWDFPLVAATDRALRSVSRTCGRYAALKAKRVS